MSSRRKSERNLEKYYFGYFFDDSPSESDEDSLYEEKAKEVVPQNLQFEENVYQYMGNSNTLVHVMSLTLTSSHER